MKAYTPSRAPKGALLAFAYYINERESIRLRRASGQPYPWSKDPAFVKYRYTNVKREYDKTTMLLKKEFYDNHRNRPAAEILRNCAFARYFGRIETMRAVGWQTRWNYDLSRKVTQLLDNDPETKIFTGAYIITNCGVPDHKERVVCERFLNPFADASEDLATLAASSQSWEAVARAMYKLPGFGGSGFMTKEVLQDALLTPVLENAKDKDTWTPVGPGALAGLNIMMGRDYKKNITEGWGFEELVMVHKDVQRYLKPHVPKLNLHDIQFCLCEYSKYWRVNNGHANTIRRVYNAPAQSGTGFAIQKRGIHAQDTKSTNANPPENKVGRFRVRG